MFERLKKALGIISKTNFTTPRKCIIAFLLALDKSDENKDGVISVREMIKLFKNMLIFSIVSDMSDEEIIDRMNSFIKRS